VESTAGEGSASVDSSDEDNKDDEEVRAVASLLNPALDEYRNGRYSPVYLSQDDLEPGTIVISEVEDVSKINIDQVGLKFCCMQTIAAVFSYAR
jgi:hypothetical protein